MRPRLDGKNQSYYGALQINQLFVVFFHIKDNLDVNYYINAIKSL